MLLLHILVGVLLVLDGSKNLILGFMAAKDAAIDVNDFDRLIEKILHPSQRYQKYMKQQVNEDQDFKDYKHQSNDFKDYRHNLNDIKDYRHNLNDFKDYRHNSNDLKEKINMKDVNFGAADVPVDIQLGAVHINHTEQRQLAIEDPTSTAKIDPTIEPNNAPLPPQPHRQEDLNSKIVVMRGNGFIFAAVVSACSVTLLVGLIMAGVFWYKLKKRVKAASTADYPAYGVTGPTKERLPSPVDDKMVQSVQMYQYQHQKQQAIVLEKANNDTEPVASNGDSEDENNEGDYTVYECPGLAPTGEMVVCNPLFMGNVQTPVNEQVTGLHDRSHDQQKYT